MRNYQNIIRYQLGQFYWSKKSCQRFYRKNVNCYPMIDIRSSKALSSCQVFLSFMRSQSVRCHIYGQWIHYQGFYSLPLHNNYHTALLSLHFMTKIRILLFCWLKNTIHIISVHFFQFITSHCVVITEAWVTLSHSDTFTQHKSHCDGITSDFTVTSRAHLFAKLKFWVNHYLYANSEV